MAKKTVRASDPGQWTDMAEAVAFISATLGEPFTTAQGEGLWWGAYASLQADGTRGYPCGVEQVEPGKIRVTITFSAAKLKAASRLYAILGWATYHGHAVEVD